MTWPLRPSQTTILVTDDHPLNRKLLGLQLKTFGVIVEEAENGLDAFNRFHLGGISLLITDLQMPICDGFELVTKIRQHERNFKIETPLPVVAWTANVLPSVMAEAHIRGMNDILGKSVDMTALKKILLRFVPEQVTLPKSSLESSLQITNPVHYGLFDPAILSASFTSLKDQWDTLKEFATQSQLDLHQIEVATKKNDLHKANNLCYKLLGASRSLGATAIIHECAKFEKKLMGNRLDELHTSKTALKLLFSDLEKYLATHLPTT